MWRARFFKAFPKIIEDYPTSRFIFLTLTVRNCQLQDLRQTLTWMNAGWKRMIQRKQWPAQGFIRSTEVTRNPDDDSAHPHFHCILMVTPSYFTGRGYISQPKWRELWASCLKVDYLPKVDVKVVKPRGGDNQEGIAIALCETLKYSVKVNDLVFSQDWLCELTRQLHKTRAVAPGGVFKNYISEEDPENLIDGDVDEDESTDYDSLITFGWREMIQLYLKQKVD